MENDNYRVTFSGKIVASKDQEEVATNLTKMFKLDLSKHEHTAKLAKLLSGKSVVIKEGISKEKARFYQKTMAAAGAICIVENCSEDNTENKPFVERRKAQRRKRGDRRAVRRTSAILPDRRKGDRRKSVQAPEPEDENGNDGNTEIVIEEYPGS